MVGTTLLHYRIIRALGQGGMGEVYAAEDTKLNRTVAVKILPAAAAANPEGLARFQREARAIAALNHPNVVTIFSVEAAGDTHFLTMELVEGKTLADLIPPTGLTLAEFLQIAIPLADAISAAHAQNVVHRDLKPSNVMVGAGRRVKVLDFGLAKLRQDSLGDVTVTSTGTDRLTAPQHVFGTPAYMSPEQAEGRPVDLRTDIFSLGIVLYEMATGRRPFTGTSPMTVISSILKDVPAPVAELRADLPADLDRILRRCLSKDPSRRYQTALDVKTELEDLRAAAPRLSRTPESSGSMVTSASRRGTRRVLFWGIGAASAGLMAGALLITQLGWPGSSPATSITHPVFTQVTSAPAAELFPSLSPDGKWIVYAGEGAGNRDIYLQSTSGQRPINLTADSPADDEQPAFSPDGEHVAFRSSRDGGGIFIMGRTGDAVRRVTREGFNPGWSPDGRRLIYSTGRMELRPQNSESVSELWFVDADGSNAQRLYGGDATLPSWSPGGERIAFGQRLGTDRNISILTIAVTGGEPVLIVASKTAIDWNPIWSPDGQYLYFSSDRGGSMNLWRVGIDEISGRQRGNPEPITTPAPFAAHLSISRDGRQLAFSSVLETQNIQRLEIDPVKAEPIGEPRNLTTGTRRWSSPDPSPDGQWVAFYSQIQPEGDLYLIKADGTGLRQLTSDPAIDRVPRWSPDGKWIAAFSDRNGRLQVWKIRPDGSDLQQVTDGPDHGVLAWAPDGHRLAATRARVGQVRGEPVVVIDPDRAWNAQTPQLLPPPSKTMPEFVANGWSPDGLRIAGQNGYVLPGVSVYSVPSRAYTRVSEIGEWPVWFPDGRRLLVVSRGREFHVIDTVARTSRLIFSVPRDTLGPPRLTADGRAAYFSRRVTEADVWLVNLQ